MTATRRRARSFSATLAVAVLGAGMVGGLALVLTLAGPSEAASTATATAAVRVSTPPAPKTPIRHFIFLMQGDRTFDNYFSTYPGANGASAETCQPLVLAKPGNGCIKPFSLHGLSVKPLAPGNTVLDYQYDHGRLDGFVAAYLHQGRDGTNAMGYYDRRDLPFYWAVADRYVLFDNFFASVRHGIRANRSYWVSAAPQPGGVDSVSAAGYPNQDTIFDRLQAAGVSWKFYVEGYDPRQTFKARSATNPAAQTARVPLLNYSRFVNSRALNEHIVDISQYYRDLAAGTLPSVAYVSSSGSSERSARSMAAGQQLVRRLVTQLMLSDAWQSSAMLWSYDGSGGWFDHVRPPTVDGQVMGPRVPALLVSPFAAKGRVDHTQLDYTSALKFIEENWGLRSLTNRDSGATSIAAALDLRVAPRPAALIQVDPPPPGQRVKVGVAYLGYLGAALLALLLLMAAAVGPALLAAERRRRRRRADSSGEAEPAPVLVGVVVSEER